MSSQTKIPEKIKSDVLNLMIKNKMKGLDLIDTLVSLVTLKIILQEIDKISIIRYLELKKDNKEKAKRIRNRKN